MSIIYKCPGTIGPGRGMTERVIHGGCCAAFTLMSAERRQKIGIRYVVPDSILAIDEAAEEPITIGELIEVVRLLQLADDEGVPAPVSRNQRVLADDNFPPEQVKALLDLGDAYGLQVTWVRPPTGS